MTNTQGTAPKSKSTDWVSESGQSVWSIGVSFAAIIILFVVLRSWASSEVRASLVWQCVYVGAGFYFWIFKIWLKIDEGLINILFRQDVIDRKNLAADLLIASCILANTICFSGANIGEGPGPEAVLFSALLANSSLAIFAFCFRVFTNTSDRITIDRDTNAAIRFGSFLIGASIVFANAAAGNWISPHDTFFDFLKLASPAPVLLLAAVLASRFIEKRNTVSRVSTVLISLITISISVLSVFLERL